MLESNANDDPHFGDHGKCDVRKDILKAVAEGAPLYSSWAQLRHTPTLPPTAPGILCLVLSQGPPGVPITGCLQREGRTLLYIGIAPRSKGGPATLRDRIRYHFQGNAYGSTLRLTLGCLLAPALGARCYPPGSLPVLSCRDPGPRHRTWHATQCREGASARAHASSSPSTWPDRWNGGIFTNRPSAHWRLITRSPSFKSSCPSFRALGVGRGGPPFRKPRIRSAASMRTRWARYLSSVIESSRGARPASRKAVTASWRSRSHSFATGSTGATGAAVVRSTARDRGASGSAGDVVSGATPAPGAALGFGGRARPNHRACTSNCTTNSTSNGGQSGIVRNSAHSGMDRCGRDSGAVRHLVDVSGGPAANRTSGTSTMTRLGCGSSAFHRG